MNEAGRTLARAVGAVVAIGTIALAWTGESVIGRPLQPEPPAVSGVTAPACADTSVDAGGTQRMKIHRGVVPSGQADPEGMDTAWARLPRVRLDFVRQALAGADAVEFELLLRSATFNPRDAVLPAAARHDIALVHAAARERARALASESAAARSREFEPARAAGRAVAIDFRRLDGDLLLAPLGKDPFFEVVEGVTYAVSREWMPRSEWCRDRLRADAVDFVEQVAAAFAKAGALTPAEQNALAARARQLCDDLRRQK